MPEPIEPTRVIPAGQAGPAPLPAAPPVAPPPPWWPPLVHQPPTVPPQRRPPNPPVPPPPPPVEIEVHARIHVTVADPPAPAGPTWAERLQLRRNAICCAIAVFTGAAPAWGSALHACWKGAGLDAAWALAGIPFAVAAVLDQLRYRLSRDPRPGDRGRGDLITRTAVWVTVLGPALGLPIIGTLAYIVTGVHPS